MVRGQAQSDEQTAEKKITFEDHIKPIFREHCTACHSASDKESDLALDSYGEALSGGSSGEVIQAGDAGGSRLFALLTHQERPYMPPDQDAIPQAQIDLVKTWIEQGMPENSGSKIKRFNTAAAAMLTPGSNAKPEGPPPMPEGLLRQPVTETDRSAAIAAMAASPWAPLIALGGQEHVCLYHSQSGDLLGIIPFPEGQPQSLSFTRDGRQLLIGGGKHSASGCAVLVDIESGERLAKVGDELDIVLAADISPDKQRIAIAGPQKIIRIYDSLTGKLVVEMKKHTDWIYALRYSPDGVLLASGDRSNGLVLWEADTGRLYAELAGHRGAVRSLDFRSDSNVLASGSLDGTIKLWDMYESKTIKSWEAHRGGVTAVAYAHNGFIASAGQDSKVKLWNGTGDLQQEFQGLSEAALEVALSGDAVHVAGGDWNGRAQVWTVATPEETKLIAANPPSLERRLQLANTTLQRTKEAFTAARQTKETAEQAVATAQEAVSQFKAQAEKASQQLKSADQEQVQLTQQVQSLDEEIQQLEQRLLALKEQRTQQKQQLQEVTTLKEKLTGETQAVQQKLQMAQEQHQNLSAQAAEAAQAFSAKAEQLAIVEQEQEQAAADLAALQKKTETLEKTQAEAVAKANELANLVESAAKAEHSSAETMEQLEAQLAAMQQQLEDLQQRIESTLAAELGAKQNLETKRTELSQLRADWEAAQQAALEAEEQLKVFRQAYGSRKD